MKASTLRRLVSDKIFAVTFIKVNGDERNMVCRLGVTKHLNPTSKGLTTGQLLGDYEHNQLRVFDVNKRQYRKVNCDSITRLAVGKLVYEVIDGVFVLTQGQLDSKQKVLINMVVEASNIINTTNV